MSSLSKAKTDVADNVKFLYLVMTSNGAPTTQWPAVAESMESTHGAITKRWSRLSLAMKDGKEPAADTYQFLWAVFKHSEMTTKGTNWKAIAEAANIVTPGAAAKRFNRLKLANQRGQEPPGMKRKRTNENLTPKKTKAGKYINSSSVEDDADGTKDIATPKCGARAAAAAAAAAAGKTIAPVAEDEDNGSDADDEKTKNPSPKRRKFDRKSKTPTRKATPKGKGKGKATTTTLIKQEPESDKMIHENSDNETFHSAPDHQGSSAPPFLRKRPTPGELRNFREMAALVGEDAGAGTEKQASAPLGNNEQEQNHARVSDWMFRLARDVDEENDEEED
ncbi:hypothetical protein GQ43DRAFT_444480 [Delitschia confertaspora ATCC 74209]|uniref:Myb-like DNA-binding domain-containing protein n=1 Tax=Delitschia confertaspora ATCC 74209 TaxID=1513339 RepID=A0A9P4JCZ8_9PLEO|nr:hypothetical protein GQ43DRAFT_444480 [Delitschia confertaspora ATCC 74209]